MNVRDLSILYSCYSNTDCIKFSNQKSNLPSQIITQVNTGMSLMISQHRLHQRKQKRLKNLRSGKRYAPRSFLDERQPIGIGVSLHESHEAVPVSWGPHDVLGLDSSRLPIHKLCVHIDRLKHTFLVNHVEAGDVTNHARRVENRGLGESEDSHSVGSVSRFS